jgi:thioesterase domain-containing protein
MKLLEFQKFLHEQIPLTKQMELEIVDFNKNEISLTSPLAPNINDKGSVFGGSSSALQIISAWSLIKLNCLKNSIDADIVIYKNNTKWQKPLFEDITVTSRFDKLTSFDEIKLQIKANKKVFINTISKALTKNKEVCSEMMAQYVLIPK